MIIKCRIMIGWIFLKISQMSNSLISVYMQSYYYNETKKIGCGVRFNGISTVTGRDSIEIGDNVHIGNNAYIRGEGGLYIGDNTHISRNLVLYTHNHNYEGALLPYDNTFKFRKVIIEKNVWIGMNVTILPGTHIEEGAIIGAGSVVAGKVDRCSIYGAKLAQSIKTRNIEHYNALERAQKYGGVGGKPIKSSSQ